MTANPVLDFDPVINEKIGFVIRDQNDALRYRVRGNQFI